MFSNDPTPTPTAVAAPDSPLNWSIRPLRRSDGNVRRTCGEARLAIAAALA
jgi:hypothetical protein